MHLQKSLTYGVHIKTGAFLIGKLKHHFTLMPFLIFLILIGPEIISNSIRFMIKRISPIKTK